MVAQLSASPSTQMLAKRRSSLDLGDSEKSPSVPDLLGMPAEPVFDREPLRVLLVGSRKGVNNTILTLYRLGFAQVSEWSPLLPAPNPGEVMSILTRYIQVDG
jgi:hypothetical protein